MSPILNAGIVVLLAILGYLMLWPVPIEPVAWNAPQSAGYTGPHARNDRLAKLRLVGISPHVGPEHIVFGPDGLLYTGVLSGAVLRMQPDGTGVEKVVDTEGRPLGLDFDASGRLVIADAVRGLLAVQPGGAVVVLADSVALEPILYADAVKVASDGKILFTDASMRFSPREHGTFDAALLDILEHSCTGRVLEYDPASSATRIVANGLCFPNGVALSADERAVIVAETGAYRILKLPREANLLDVGGALQARDAAVQVLLDNLPGFPDNVMRGSEGRYWVGLTKPRSDDIDGMSRKPWLRALTLRLPRALWPVPPAYGHVIAFDESGRVLADLQDPSGRLPETSGATEHQGQVYVQSLHAEALGMLPLSVP
ncbi:MAG TPA: SMP-30/gluconolactonase/LRE family protein [Steroidobacteraceae bacterium]|nr:SMP-30/gluconolactonase/LRE family protein [Steroidobacteraceae bacterium]